jgi:hypothetical protein
MIFRFYNMYRLFRSVFIPRWCTLEHNYNQPPSKYTLSLLSQEMVYAIQHTKQGTVLWCIHLVNTCLWIFLTNQHDCTQPTVVNEVIISNRCIFLNGEMKNYLVLRLWVCHAERALGKQKVPGNHEKSWITGNPAPHVYRVLHKSATPSILSSKLMA